MRLPFVAAPGWWVGATCRQESIPLAVFFDREHLRLARQTCDGCPVRLRCLTEHLDEPFGVWGGHDRSERSRIRSAVDRGTTIADASCMIDDRRARRGTGTP